MDATSTILAGFPVVLVITQLVHAARAAGMPSRFAPLLAIALGIAIAVAAQASGVTVAPNWFATVMVGILYGLASSGAYSGVKAVTKTDTKMDASS